MDITKLVAEVENMDLDSKIEFIVTTTLGLLKGVFEDNKLTDREVTLTLHYFITRFVKIGWKGQKPITILEETIKIIKDRKENTAIKIGSAS